MERISEGQTFRKTFSHQHKFCFKESDTPRRSPSDRHGVRRCPPQKADYLIFAFLSFLEVRRGTTGRVTKSLDGAAERESLLPAQARRQAADSHPKKKPQSLFYL